MLVTIDVTNRQFFFGQRAASAWVPVALRGREQTLSPDSECEPDIATVIGRDQYGDSSDAHSSEGTSGSRLVESAAQAAFNGRGERTRASNVEEGNTCCIRAVDSTTLIEPGSPREKVDESLSSS